MTLSSYERHRQEGTNCSFKKISEKDITKEEGKGVHNMQILEVLVTDRVEPSSVKNSKDVNVRVLNVDNYHHAHLCVGMEQSKNLDNLPLEVGMSLVTSLRGAFHLYGSDYSCGTLSITFLPEVSVKEITTYSTDCTKAGRGLLNTGGKVLLLKRCYRLKALQQCHVERNKGWIQHQIQACLIGLEYEVANSEAK